MVDNCTACSIWLDVGPIIEELALWDEPCARLKCPNISLTGLYNDMFLYQNKSKIFWFFLMILLEKLLNSCLSMFWIWFGCCDVLFLRLCLWLSITIFDLHKHKMFAFLLFCQRMFLKWKAGKRQLRKFKDCWNLDQTFS